MTRSSVSPTQPYPWQFIRSGGVDQVIFSRGADIAALRQLDQKLWVALACPTRGIDFDTRTLDLIDTDGDGRVRAPEVITACEWVCERLADADSLLRGSDCLTADTLSAQTEPGIKLAAETRRILTLLGKAETDALTLDDISGRSEWLAAMRFNGDGVVTPDTAEEPAVRATIEHVMRTHGSLSDRHEKRPGVDRARVTAFFADVDAVQGWYASARNDDRALVNFGAHALAAAQAASAVDAKIDDFFARCKVAAYDRHAVAALNPAPETYDALASQTIDLAATPIGDLPLATVAPGASLPLQGGRVNPAWAAAIAKFQADAVAPLLGPHEALSESDWITLQQQLAPCREWMARRPDNALRDLEVAHIDALLATRTDVLALIDQDEAAETHNAQLVDLEKLLRLQRDLVVLLNNFVSFKAFYAREGAIFQAGTLYLDGRSCELTVQVQDVAKHAVLAGLAKTCLAYCDCTRQGQRMQIVAAFTAGDIDFLFPGRNGVFYDRKGNDWDATITKLIENPTSILQAFFSPYKKFIRMIEEQVAKRAAANDATAQGSLQSMAGKITTLGQPAATAGATGTAAAPLRAGRIDVGTVAALGVALGSISAVMVGIFAKFIDLGQWIPVALLGIVIAISGPSMLIAWLKLRQRSLGPILDASGWAINGRMKVNVRLGGMLSQTAHVPPGARRVASDPNRERHGVAGLVATAVLIAALAVLAWRMDWLDRYLPTAIRHGVVAVAPMAPKAAAEPAG